MSKYVLASFAMVLYVKDGERRFDSHLLDFISKGKYEEALMMLQNIDPCNLSDSSGRSLLHWTILRCEINGGNVYMIQYFIHKGCNINAQNEDGDTPLLLAVKAKQTSAVKTLIQLNADIFLPNNFGCTPVQHVLNKYPLSEKDIAKLFLRKLQLHCGTDKRMFAFKLMNYQCPIYFAVLPRDAEITRTMLDSGCLVNIRCPETYDNAMHVAVAQSDLANVKLLLERGANVNSLGCERKTPLQHYDVSANDTEEKIAMLKVLMTWGASLRITEGSVTLLEKFMRRGKKGTVRALLQSPGIDWRARNALRQTAIHFIACCNKNPDVEELIPLFRGKNFDINALDCNGNTALMLSAMEGHVKQVEYLLKLGANPNILDQHDHTPLYYICKQLNNAQRKPVENYRRIAELLLVYDADFQNTRYRNFLSIYSEGSNDPYITESLIAKLAEMELVDATVHSQFTRHDMEEVQRYREYFYFCQQSLEHMKLVQVDGFFTLFDLYTGNNKKQIIRYARKRVFATASQPMIIDNFNSFPHYYSSIILWRMAAAEKVANLELQSMDFISMSMKLYQSRVIACKILKYLDEYDMINLLGLV
ncbi:alpha-latrocrustotoxin-Lt1a-like [Phymastichus coffea]|uniref:alpha-latrocrustotoxin-Lt1a-like n=1 Tax=Phymastichus coffea TaxID=108790 RepID=UPI00273B84B8|nr:alpha-latrocrustotoxin-Lt1a-like [Phymastichus coffea]